jgi:hypothetical protein
MDEMHHLDDLPLLFVDDSNSVTPGTIAETPVHNGDATSFLAEKSGNTVIFSSSDAKEVTSPCMDTI